MNFLATNNSILSEELLAVINNLPYPLYWTDLDCKLIGANQAFLKLLEINSLKNFAKDDLYNKISDVFDLNTREIKEFRLDDLNIVFSKIALTKIFETNSIKYQINKIPLINNSNQEITGVLTTFHPIPNTELPKNINHKISKKKSKIRTLIIEDNKIAAEVTQALFLSLKCHVDIALNAEIAIELFKKNKYDFVLMDIELSNTSGYILAKKLRQIEKSNRTIIIALTTYKADVVKYDCGDYKMNAVVSKPLSLIQANNIIQKFVHFEKIEIPGLLEVEAL